MRPLVLVLAVSAGYEALFLHHGIGWLYDEGWPLYAAMRLHAGGVLYGDVFWSFPPGHLLPAWIGYGLAPPGILPARVIYAAFTVALCGSLYLLGRRLMPWPFAVVGALMLALSAPRAHMQHYVFGYRYLVFSVLALLAFDRRLVTGDGRFMLVAGALAGVALCFRLTPAVAVSCGIAVAIVAADRDPRRWLRDAAGYAAGMAAVAVPVGLFFAHGVGLERLWLEVVVRQIRLTALQDLPIPGLTLPPEWTRTNVIAWFIALQFYLYPILYLGYGLWLAVDWRRCARRGESFSQALLLAVVVWGAVYFLRTLGRSDEAHLVSALPPACLLLAHGASGVFTAASSHAGLGVLPRRLASTAVAAALVLGWVWLEGSDRYFGPARRGTVPLAATGGAISVPSRGFARNVDDIVATIREATGPDQPILTATNAPLFYVLTQRRGPGHLDTLMPGTFFDEEEELAFLARLQAEPPAAVIWPKRPFDGRRERSLRRTAPHVDAWIRDNYERPTLRADGEPAREAAPEPKPRPVSPALRAALRDQVFRLLLPRSVAEVGWADAKRTPP